MASLKVFTDGYLKSKGINAHEVKEEYGCKPVSHYDIYNGPTVTIRDKQGNLFVDTKLTPDEFFEEFGMTKGNTKGGRGGKEW